MNAGKFLQKYIYVPGKVLNKESEMLLYS
jgi:hypothetical protein